MALVESFAPFFTDFAAAGTVNGVAVSGIVDIEDFDEGPQGAITQRTIVTLKPTTAVTPAVGHAAVFGGVTYNVRQVLRDSPDGALTRLVLVRA